MKPYPKIQSLFLRDPANKNKTFLAGEFTCPEFKYLYNCTWVGTEKVDGTNIRIIKKDNKIIFKGRTENAQIPATLYEKLQSIFTIEKMTKQFDDMGVCLYGEGYGKNIGKSGSLYLKDDVDFVLFDCLIGESWLLRDSLKEIAKNLDIKLVPVVSLGELEVILTEIQEDSGWSAVAYASELSENETLRAEGLVLQPAIPLFNRKGERIITKLKFCDFKEEVEK